MAISSQSIKGAGTNIDVRIGCADNEDQEAPIDNMGEDGNTSKLHRNNKRARRGTRALLGPADEQVIGIRHRHTEYQRAKHVEEDDPPQGLADGHAYSLARVGRLAKGDADDLGASIREAGLHHGGPESKEAAGRPIDEVLSKSTWVMPVCEADHFAGGLTAHGDDETGHDEHDDDKEFDGGHPELGFAEERYVKDLRLVSVVGVEGFVAYCITDVDSDNCNRKGCNKYGNVEVRAPVLYDNSGGREVVREDNRVFEKVIPSCGVPRMGQLSPEVGVPRQLAPKLDQQIGLRIQRSLCPRAA